MPDHPISGGDALKNDAAPRSREGGAKDGIDLNNSTPTQPTGPAPASEIARFLRLLFSDGDVFEVRVPKCPDRPGSTFTSTVSGYFTHATIDAATEAITKLDAQNQPPGIYVTMNAVRPDLLARSANKLKGKAHAATQDTDIVARRWMLLDFDPCRAAGISASEPELQAACERAMHVVAALSAEGWPAPILGLSGNGVHAIYRIDLSADDGGVIARVLSGLADRFDTDHVHLDRSVHNAARITKVLGTMARKGDNVVGIAGIEDRPHRRAALLSEPETLIAVSSEQLDEAAAPKRTRSSEGPVVRGLDQPHLGPTCFDRFEHTPDGVREYLERHGLRVTGQKTKGNCTWLHLDRCPVVPGCESTGGSDISVGVGQNGVLIYRNQHARGHGLKWVDVREALEPGYRVWSASKSLGQAHGAVAQTAAEGVKEESEVEWPTPKPLDDGARPPAFPIDTAFPAELCDLRAFVEAVAEQLQVPVDLPAMSILPFIGVAVAKKFEIELRPGWREVPAIWTIALLPSGERKSATFSLLVAPILDWEKRQAERLEPEIVKALEERRVAEARLNNQRKVASKAKDDELRAATARAVDLAQGLADMPIPIVPTVYTSDATTEALAGLLANNHERALVASPEADALDVMMGRYTEKGSPNMGIWLKGHAGDAERVIRRSRAPEFLKRPVLNVAMVVQPDSISGMFASRQARGRGLLARFLPSAPESRLGQRKTGGTAETIPNRLYEVYRRSLNRILDVAIDEENGPAIARLGPEALPLFNEFEARIEAQLSPSGTLGNRSDWGGKLCGAVARIALLLHVMVWAVRGGEEAPSIGTPEISESTMSAALSWAPYLIDHERLVAGVVGADRESVVAKRLLTWLCRIGASSFTRRDAFTATRCELVKVVEDIDGPLAVLQDLGYVRLQARRQTSPVGGRTPSPTFLVNPRWDRGDTP